MIVSDARIEIETIDRPSNTYITIGCYRETSRLNRVLETFQIAMTLAARDGLGDALATALKSLHDHKGELTVCWTSMQASIPLRTYVDCAWKQQGEHEVSHLEVI